MDKCQTIFFAIKKQIEYIFNDEYIILSKNYHKCMSKVFNILQDALNKIEKIYYEYVLYPKLCELHKT